MNKNMSININLEGETEEEILAELEQKLPKELKPKDNFLNKLLNIIDKKIFSLSDNFIADWVKEENFKYNKYGIFAKLRLMTAVVFIAVIFVALFQKDIESLFIRILAIVINVFVFFAMAYVQYTQKHKNDLLSDAYMTLFKSRSNPMVYSFVKLQSKIEFIMRKKERFFKVGIQLLFTFLYYSIFTPLLLTGEHTSTMSYVVIFSFLPSFILDIVEGYSFYIFDFGKPDKKKEKEAKKSYSLSKIAQKVFDDMVGRAKSPVGNQA